VLVPDLPGHGLSDTPRDPGSYAVDGVAASLAEVVARLDDGPADWVGYSMGGRILLAGVAEGHIRARRLVLESSSPGLADPGARTRRRRLDFARADALDRDGLEAFVTAWLELPLFATQAVLPVEVRHREVLRRLQQDPAAIAACLRGGGTGSQRSYWEALSTVRVPTTLLTGTRDEKFGRIADRMVDRFPNGRHRRIPDAGHAIHLERPEAWLAAVRSALGITT
jgi:2-succinyl-6-hydroxy-2,4-cyclohexadiene-1-carboxylate synthase